MEAAARAFEGEMKDPKKEAYPCLFSCLFFAGGEGDVSRRGEGMWSLEEDDMFGEEYPCCGEEVGVDERSSMRWSEKDGPLCFVFVGDVDEARGVSPSSLSFTSATGKAFVAEARPWPLGRDSNR